MIPKIIHYCWFGRKPLPDDALKYIATWRERCRGYKIVEWNEDNFPLDEYPYARQAYDAGKYAFVSDVARLYALKTMGGIYLDTDVEVIKPFDDFLHHTAFTSFEQADAITTGVIGSEPRGRYVSENLDEYTARSFVRADGSYDTTTNVAHMTAYLRKQGLTFNDRQQELPGLLTVYPREYFCPRDSYAYAKGLSHFTANTHAIHHFAGTWQVRNTPQYKELRAKYRFIPYFIRKHLILALMGESRKGFWPTLLRLIGHHSQR